MIHQCRLRWASTPAAWTTDAMGRTMMAEMTPWMAPDRTLAHRHQPDRARRLDPVLDLAGEPELLGHLQRHRLDALEHDRDPHHAGDEHGGERRLARARPLHRRRRPGRSWGRRRGRRSTAETAAPRCGRTNSTKCFRSTTRSRSISAPRAIRLAERPSGSAWAVAIGPRARAGAGSRSSSSVAQLPAGEVDEHGLEASARPPRGRAPRSRRLGRRHQPGEQAGPCPCTCSSTPPSAARRAGDAFDVLGAGARGQLARVAGRPDGDDGVGPDALLEARRGVEGQDPAVVHDRHPAAELVRLLHVVGGQQDRLAARR